MTPDIRVSGDGRPGPTPGDDIQVAPVDPSSDVEHHVRFYEDEALLARAVGEFLAQGHEAGDALLVIATPARREAFLRQLETAELKPEQLEESGRLTVLDAEETLATFMRDGEPDPEQFERSVGELVSSLTGLASGPGRLRAYGEMVDVLWQAGEQRAALRLEELWTDLQRRHPFTLLCAYAIANFYKEPADLRAVCDRHTAVALGDGHALRLPAGPHRYIRLLANEIAQRKQIEKALRESLANLRARERVLHQAEQMMRVRARHPERLLRITAAIADAVTSAEVYTALVDHVSDTVGASTAALWLVDDGTGTARLARARGYTDAALRELEMVPLDLTPSLPILDCIRFREPVWIPTQQSMLERYPHLAPLATIGRSYRVACLPLMAQGRVLGALGLTTEDPAEANENEFLMLVARYAGQSIERLRLLEAERASRADADAAAMRAGQLYRFAHAVVAADCVERVYEAAIDAIEAALHADRSAVLTCDAEGVMRFRAWRRLSDEYRAAVEGHSPWPRDAVAPEPVLVPDAQSDPAMAAYRPLFAREGIGALAFIPLVTTGQLLGKFMVYYDRPHPFQPHELDTARAISNHLASVITRFSAISRLEETIRSNELFAGALAHDLRNPLGAIMMSAQVALMRREGRADDGDDRPLSRILSSGQRMRTMIEQLLDFTRARTGGGIEIDPHAADLAELCDQVLGELEIAHPEWRIECERRGKLDGVWDSGRLLQVLSNLIANAGEHGVRGATVRVLLDGRVSDHVALEVHNQGEVPADLLPELFDPFRSTRHHREQSRGVGLGLFIVREIVRAHGGDVDVTSSAGAGTTFRVRLPRVSPRKAPAVTALR